MKKIKILPAREQIALEIKNAILTGEIPAGSELIQEKIAETLGVSRMPIREAILILERDHFIELVNGRKAIVRTFSEADIIEHYELRALLECECTKKAALSQNDYTTLVKYHEEMKQAIDVAEFRRINKLFHEHIWELSGGRRIQHMIESLWDHIPPVVMNIAPDHEIKSITEHEEIVNGIINGDPTRANEAMKTHIMRSLHDYLEHKKQA